MKIYGGSSESDIPGLFRQTEIRDVARKLELWKGFQFQLSATKRCIHTIKLVGHEIMLQSNTSSRENIEYKKTPCTYFKNTFSNIISALNKYITCFVM